MINKLTFYFYEHNEITFNQWLEDNRALPN